MKSQTIGLLLNYLDARRSIRCIQSLLDEGVARVVVWDNSADGGLSIAAIRNEFADDSRLEVRVSSTNLGFAAGVNRGLEYCARLNPKAWVLLINNDARLLPGALFALVAALHSSPVASLAFPNINHAGHVLGPAYCHRLSGLLSWRPRAGFFRYASGCCMLIAIDRVALPLFDEDFFMYGEDCELGWRLGQQVHALVHVDETLVEHDGAAGSGLGSMFYEAHIVAAHLILARKLGRSAVDMCLLHAARVAMLIARAVVRCIRYRSLIPFKALWLGAVLAFRRR